MRAQTTLDFSLGIVIFLVVIAFVFTFVPGILEPFDAGDQAEPAVSDRVANSLAQDLLGSTQSPNVLDRYCTVTFFNQSGVPGDCRYEATSVHDEFDLPPQLNVNVSLSANINETNEGVNHLCWTEEASEHGQPPNEPGLDELVDCDIGGGDIALAMGDTPPGTVVSTITARRVVSLHGQSVTLKVVLW